MVGGPALAAVFANLLSSSEVAEMGEFPINAGCYGGAFLLLTLGASVLGAVSIILCAASIGVLFVPISDAKKRVWQPKRSTAMLQRCSARRALRSCSLVLS